ncbi:MAG: hypothetical protein Q8R20_03690 [Nanoarchaeota archaeon]|nr:hypothetical protein [Nanoarchaeota archaeon]
MIILVILDGWGIGRADDSNPIRVANPEWMNYLKANFPFGALKAHGLSVGAEWEKPGSSELGHLTIGTGRTVSSNERDKPPIQNPLGKMLEDHGKTVLKIAESSKERNITYYFNGLEEKPFRGEFRVILPGKPTPRPETHPEMQAEAITDRAIAAINERGFDLIIINYANADVIADTANFDGIKKAIRAIDKELGRLYENAIPRGHAILIVGSHGNAEMILDPLTGSPKKGHDRNPVLISLVRTDLARPRNPAPYAETPTLGLLSDVAPTILELMGLPIPPEMTGESLLAQLT